MANYSDKTILIILFLLLPLAKNRLLAQHEIELDLIEFDSVNLNKKSSLLDSSFSGVKYFFLGELSHGDGQTLKAKNALIRYLVLNRGFEVILLERNIYQMGKVNIQIKHSNDPYSISLVNETLRNDEFLSSGLSELASFIISNKAKVDIGGVDIANGTMLTNCLFQDLIHVGINKSAVSAYQKQLLILTKIGLCFDCDSKFDFVRFNKLSNMILNQLSSKADRSTMFLIRAIKSHLNLADWVRNRPQRIIGQDRISFRKVHELRDKYMSQNLIWHINNFYPNKKVIISTATIHMTPKIGEQPMTMVDYLPDSIKEKSFFLPFITYQGVRGFDTYTKLFELSEVRSDPSSLEYQLHIKGMKFGFIDFSKLNVIQKNYLDSKVMHPSILLPAKSNWSKVYSGLFFIDNMTPDIWRPLKVNIKICQGLD